ncbi:hypothetical protein DNU06_04470 [Putridiphycobacter roseus]|uniref:Uncharacterized protein n=1 Tax=Putridiphycobacter roseus TaxID=2219161 RepID=A0A2W1NT57_9FLAO|nr:hypothetical protein [Putridiphycobacter roseus]PZE17878.1 hypothetical protein DNU06_04470 [Putridiphycobacter roseus]
MKTSLYLFTLLFILFFNASCKTLKGVKEMKTETINLKEYSNGLKDVAFIGIHHVGKISYYANLTETIKSYKEKGYTVFYEQLSETNIVNDSSKLDIENRKMRKIVGFYSGATGYGSIIEDFKKTGLKSFTAFANKLMVQPSYEIMGLDSLDYNADANRTNFVAEFEARFGGLVLDSMDYHTHLDSAYSRPNVVSKSKKKKIIVDYRNEVLAKNTLNSKEEKILIIFGEGHRKGFYKILKKEDKNWKKIKSA